MSFSNLELTTTSFSVTIEGTISGSVPNQGKDLLFVVNPNAVANPGFVILDAEEATIKNFSGSPSLAVPPGIYGGALGTSSDGMDYFFAAFANDLVSGSTLEGTLAGSWSSTVFDPNAVTSLEFWWGFNGPDPTSGTLLGSASLSAVPDKGSTAALLGAGVVALAFARRRLG